MGKSRKRFWISSHRILAKSNCVLYQPFQHTILDYFGPIKYKYGRKLQKKGYGVVFTCVTTCEVFVDFATDISTETFLLVFRRFIIHFGSPLVVRSDNSSNFIGAAKEIKEIK